MEIIEKIKQVVRNVSGTKDEAPRVEFDTTTPEGLAMLEEQRKLNNRSWPTTLGDLETLYEQIEENLSYWETVRSDAQAKAKIAESWLSAAKETLAEIGDKPRGETKVHYKKKAEVTIEREQRTADYQNRRVKVAEAQLKTWAQRAKDFPKEELNKLRAEYNVIHRIDRNRSKDRVRPLLLDPDPIIRGADGRPVSVRELRGETF